MTLSFNKLNEIANLYENIAASEQEQLNEVLMPNAGRPTAASSAAGPARAAQASAQASKAFQARQNAYRSARTNTLPGATTKSQLVGSRPVAQPPAAGKKLTSTDTPTRPTAPSTPSAKVAPSGAKPATTPKVVPTKSAAPKPAMGTTAGGTKFERRTATSAELAAARKARDEAKAAGNTKGAEEAAIRAGVAAGKSTLKQSFEYDTYDLVLEYLLSQGHAETIAEAQYIMTEMDAEMIGDIVEVRMDPRGRPASGPMNVYAKSKGKPDQAHLDAVKAYDEKQKKKSPEQKKKELDAYKERQRNR